MVGNKAAFRFMGGAGAFVIVLFFLTVDAVAQTEPRPVLQQRSIDLRDLRLALPQPEVTPGLN